MGAPRGLFRPDATYANAGAGDAPIEGRDAIIEYFRRDVSGTDRRFDSRTLEAVSKPGVTGNRLNRRWRCTYALAGAPDLVVEDEAHYEFNEHLIQSMEQRLTPESLERYSAWMEKHGHLLQEK